MVEQSPVQSSEDKSAAESKKRLTATQFLVRGLAISLPSILTLVILIWAVRGINEYVIYPISSAVRFTIALGIEKSLPVDQFVADNRLPPLEHCQQRYRITKELDKRLPQLMRDFEKERAAALEPGEPPNAPPRRAAGESSRANIPVEIIRRNLDQVYVPLGGKAVPYEDYAEVADRLGASQMPTSAIGVYMELVTTRYFRSLFNLSAVAVALTIVLLYFLGRFVTVRVGRWVVNRFETTVMARLPVVSNVYSSVKQVTDFLFAERSVSYNRVVAIEYPGPGIWSLGFVTSDSFLELAVAVGEPLVAVMMPTSPMPMAGFTVNVPRSKIIDLNVSIDQIFQFCLSCGVLVPPHQQVTPERLQQEFAKRLAATTSRMVQAPGGAPAAASVPFPIPRPPQSPSPALPDARSTPQPPEHPPGETPP